MRLQNEKLEFCIYFDVVTVKMPHLTLLQWQYVSNCKKSLALRTFKHNHTLLELSQQTSIVPFVVVHFYHDLLWTWNTSIVWVQFLKYSKTPQALNACPAEAVRNQSVLVHFQKVTNDFPLGFTVSPAHITPTTNPWHPHPSPLNSLPSGWSGADQSQRRINASDWAVA